VSKLPYSPSSPEIGKTLLQAGLWAITDRFFPIPGAGCPTDNSEQFREVLVQRAIREKMIPMLDAFSRVHDLGLGDVPRQLTEVYRLISSEQYVHLRPVLDDLGSRKIPVVLIKGADLDLAIYRKRFPRVMGDIDILVRPPDISAVAETFMAHGFVQGKLDKSLLKVVPLTVSEKEELEEGSIELAEYAKLVSVPGLMPFEKVINEYLSYWRMMALNETFYLTIGYDVHVHLSLEFDLGDVWTGLRTTDFPEIGPCLAQSFTDMVWYLTVRFYHELHLSSAFVMRAFLDVLLIVQRHHSELDWERITYVAGKYRLYPALYYTFWHVNEILGQVVPPAVLDALYPPTAESSRGHDWGDFIPRLVGEAPVLPIVRSATV
jgi:Uncharacterised nucleotidyltransferase